MINESFLSAEQEKRFGKAITDYVLDGIPTPDGISTELREVFNYVTTCQNPDEKPFACDADAARTVVITYDEARLAAKATEQRELTSKNYHLVLHLFCSSGLNNEERFNFPVACCSGIRKAHNRNIDDARLMDGNQYSGSVYLAISKCIDSILDLDERVEMREKNQEGKSITISTTPRALFHEYRDSNKTLFHVFKKMICSTSCKSFEEMNSNISKDTSDGDYYFDTVPSSENTPLQIIVAQDHENADRVKQNFYKIKSRIIDLYKRMLVCMLQVPGKKNTFILWWYYIRGEKLFRVHEKEGIDELAALTQDEKDHYVRALRYLKKCFLAKIHDDESKQNIIHEVFRLCDEDVEAARDDAVRILRDVFSSSNPNKLLKDSSEAFWETFAALYPDGLNGNDFEALFYPSPIEVKGEIVETLLKQRGKNHYKQFIDQWYYKTSIEHQSISPKEVWEEFSEITKLRWVFVRTINRLKRLYDAIS